MPFAARWWQGEAALRAEVRGRRAAAAGLLLVPGKGLWHRGELLHGSGSFRAIPLRLACSQFDHKAEWAGGCASCPPLIPH